MNVTYRIQVATPDCKPVAPPVYLQEFAFGPYVTASEECAFWTSDENAARHIVQLLNLLNLRHIALQPAQHWRAFPRERAA